MDHREEVRYGWTGLGGASLSRWNLFVALALVLFPLAAVPVTAYRRVVSDEDGLYAAFLDSSVSEVLLTNSIDISFTKAGASQPLLVDRDVVLTGPGNGTRPRLDFGFASKDRVRLAPGVRVTFHRLVVANLLVPVPLAGRAHRGRNVGLQQKFLPQQQHQDQEEQQHQHDMRHRRLAIQQQQQRDEQQQQQQGRQELAVVSFFSVAPSPAASARDGPGVPSLVWEGAVHLRARCSPMENMYPMWSRQHRPSSPHPGLDRSPSQQGKPQLGQQGQQGQQQQRRRRLRGREPGRKQEQGGGTQQALAVTEEEAMHCLPGPAAGGPCRSPALRSTGRDVEVYSRDGFRLRFVGTVTVCDTFAPQETASRAQSGLLPRDRAEGEAGVGRERWGGEAGGRRGGTAGRQGRRKVLLAERHRAGDPDPEAPEAPGAHLIHRAALRVAGGSSSGPGGSGSLGGAAPRTAGVLGSSLPLAGMVMLLLLTPLTVFFCIYRRRARHKPTTPGAARNTTSTTTTTTGGGGGGFSNLDMDIESAPAAAKRPPGQACDSGGTPFTTAAAAATSTTTITTAITTTISGSAKGTSTIPTGASGSGTHRGGVLLPAATVTATADPAASVAASSGPCVCTGAPLYSHDTGTASTTDFLLFSTAAGVGRATHGSVKDPGVAAAASGAGPGGLGSRWGTGLLGRPSGSNRGVRQQGMPYQPQWLTSTAESEDTGVPADSDAAGGGCGISTRVQTAAPQQQQPLGPAPRTSPAGGAGGSSTQTGFMTLLRSLVSRGSTPSSPCPTATDTSGHHSADAARGLPGAGAAGSAPTGATATAAAVLAGGGGGHRTLGIGANAIRSAPAAATEAAGRGSPPVAAAMGTETPRQRGVKSGAEPGPAGVQGVQGGPGASGNSRPTISEIQREVERLERELLRAPSGGVTGGGGTSSRRRGGQRSTSGRSLEAAQRATPNTAGAEAPNPAASNSGARAAGAGGAAHAAVA